MKPKSTFDRVMKDPKRKKKFDEGYKKSLLREYWMVESEYGMDFKRYIINNLKTEKEAKAFLKYLQIRNPLDKHELIHVREVEK